MGRRKSVKRRGQPSSPKRRRASAPNPFRQTASGFESLIPRDGSEDFFFSQWLENPDSAAEFLEHGGEDWDHLETSPRLGVGVSAFGHIVLLLFLLFEPNLREMLNLPSSSEEQQVVEIDKSEPLVLFVEPPQVEPVVPAVPVPAQPVPQPQEQPQPEPPPQVADNSLRIPRAMLAPDNPSEFMNDLPFSRGNTDEFYTEEEVKDPGTEGEPEDIVEPEEALVPAETGEDDTNAEEVFGGDEGEDAPQVANRRIDADELGRLLFGERSPEEQRAREEARRSQRIRPPDPRTARSDIGEGGENGRFTDIRRFLAGAQFHNPDGGLVVNRGNTMYYNDKGANFVPWIGRLIAEVKRTWYASMPYAAAIYRGHVAVGISVNRNGDVVELNTLVPSGVASFDNIAVGSIRAADLLPLPADYPDDRFDIILVFWYNERPYDIFG